MKFDYQTPTLDTSWRSIILLGRNVASYKFSLAKTLLQLNANNDLIPLNEIALPFAKNIASHLAVEDKQATSPASKFLDACREFNSEKISEEQLREETIQRGFVNVIDAFHNVANSEVPFRFFEDLRKDSKAIKLTDNFYKLLESEQADNFLFEVDSRWRLWETAISQNIHQNLIEHDASSQVLFALNRDYRRINVTTARDALNGYQKGRCFYCSRAILIESGSPSSCEVDHFFPHFLVRHGCLDINNIWNLVLSCQNCNRGANGKFDRFAHVKFLTALDTRNTFYIESHHPLRETIIKQTGATKASRQEFLQHYFNKVLEIRPVLKQDLWEPEEYFGDHNTLLTI